MRSTQFGVRCIVFIACLTGMPAAFANDGQFEGELTLKPLGDGTNMQLLSPFAYTDTRGRSWNVPAGSTTDGASIPQALWSIVGSPFTGKYLSAAVIHDHYCRTKYRSWMDTHDIFYEAMIAGGVPRKQALLMWAAVYRFGPRWAKSESMCWDFCSGPSSFLENVSIKPKFYPAELNKIRNKVESTDDVNKDDLKSFIDNTFESPDGQKFEAHMEGYLGGADEADEGDEPQSRRYISQDAPKNWYRVGGPDTQTFETPIWKVIKVKDGDTLKMRAKASTDSTVVGEIPANATGITFVAECKSKWCEVQFQKKRGWINTQFIQVDFAETKRKQ